MTQVPATPAARFFKTVVRPDATSKTGNIFLIIEQESGRGMTVSREAAWQGARSQIHPVKAILLDGEIKDLGVVFEPELFERALYSGHIGYNLSMTDGHYAPEPFEVWIAAFRKVVIETADEIIDPHRIGRQKVLDYIDAPREVKGSLVIYTLWLSTL